MRRHSIPLSIVIVCLIALCAFETSAGQVPSGRRTVETLPQEGVSTVSPDQQQLFKQRTQFAPTIGQYREGLASVGPGDVFANHDCTNPVISPDGRYVSFLSKADNLTGDTLTGVASRVYTRDIVNGTTRLISDADNTDRLFLSGGGVTQTTNPTSCISFMKHSSPNSYSLEVGEVGGQHNIIEDHLYGYTISTLRTAMSHDCSRLAYVAIQARPNQEDWINVMVDEIQYSPYIRSLSSASTTIYNGDPFYSYTYDDKDRTTTYLLPNEYCMDVNANNPVCADGGRDRSLSICNANRRVLFPAVQVATGKTVLMLGTYDPVQDVRVIGVPGGYVNHAAVVSRLSGDGQFMTFVYENMAGDKFVMHCEITVAGDSASCSPPSNVGRGTQPSISYFGDKVAYSDTNGFIKVKDIDDDIVTYVDYGENPVLNRDASTEQNQDGAYVTYEKVVDGVRQIFVKKVVW